VESLLEEGGSLVVASGQAAPVLEAVDAAVDGVALSFEARLSPLQFDHINFLGRYAFSRPQEAGRRPLREPSTGGEDDGGR
jgi:hypothetical protein